MSETDDKKPVIIEGVLVDPVSTSAAEIIPTPVKKVRGKPFVKGDPRINKKGNQVGLKTFMDLRMLAQKIAAEKVKGRDGQLYETAEVILRAMAANKDPREHQKFLEIAFGKVPDQVDITTNGESINKPLTETEIAERIIQILTIARERLAEKDNQT